jgi:ergothioneine biosynthesis protein EgtB
MPLVKLRALRAPAARPVHVLAAPPKAPSAAALAAAYAAVRAHSARLTRPLTVEDHGLQSMPDASPTKWHLAHTTWFFETMVLRASPGYQPFDPAYFYLFNSYYEALGPRHPRPQRGLLSRPSLDDVWRYRAHVDAALQAFLSTASAHRLADAAPIITLGLHHEQQHQELILTDIKHAFSLNPGWPAYAAAAPSAAHDTLPMQWVRGPEGLVEIGHGEGNDEGPHEGSSDGFAFDNEGPRHAVLLHPFELANRLVTCGEFAGFIRDGGYRRPELWLSDGWAEVQRQDWQAPAYWVPAEAGGFDLFTLQGLRAMNPAEPVCHISFYEAAAYAEWAGARLPTEFEWEAAVQTQPACALNDGMHPRPARPGAMPLKQIGTDVWEWTRSAYAPYPGFQPMAGAAGEYNGKFMINQMVLRGGSCATPHGHLRTSYRNFFPPAARWQFSGLRLARNA